MNIGILLPRSNAHPRIGLDFMDGLKLFMKEQQLQGEINFLTESIGFGGSEKEVYAKAEKLLVIDDADVLVAFVDEKVLEMLKPLLLATGKLLLVVNPGANHPQNWVPQANIIQLGLQHAFLAALTGSMACTAKNTGAVMATCFYDCGYMHLAAMVNEFVKEGGSIQHNYVNNQLYDDAFDIKPLTAFLSENKNTKNLLCIFDSLPASLVYKLLNSYEDAANLKLFVSPMMLEPKALENIGQGFKFAVEGYLPWHISINSETNLHFVDSCRQQVKKEPGIFSLLGWETAMILQQVYNHCKEDYRDGSSITTFLKKITMLSPRGELKLDPATQFFMAPAGKCSIYKGSSEMDMQWNINLEKEWEDFVEQPVYEVMSGWTNTYLCY